LKKKIKGRLFIVGCPRSGTTLLQSLLSVHSKIKSFPETHFFPNLISRNWRLYLGISSPRAKERIYEFLNEINCNKLKKYIPKHAFLIRQYSEFFVNILDRLVLDQDKLYWLEKTPIHLHYVNIIEKYIPNAKIIHILRNGTDVVASLFEVTNKFPNEWGGSRTIEQCIKRWNNDINISKKYFYKENHKIIKYEDLTNNTKYVLEDICEFIGIEYENNMLEGYKKVIKDITLKKQFWVNKNTKKNIENMNNKKFKKIFSKEEQKWIIKNLEKYL